MWFLRKSRVCSRLCTLVHNLFIFLGCQFMQVIAQCGHGLEPTCVWSYEPTTALLWQPKSDSGDPYVELSNCEYPDCGIGTIHTPWLAPRDYQVETDLSYMIYGTSQVYFRLNLRLDGSSSVTTLFSKEGNYAYGYPETWTRVSVRIPAAHTRYKLLLKAYVPYAEAMVAVKGINLDGSIIVRGTDSTSTTTSSTRTSTPTSTRATRSTSSTTSTTTTTARPNEDGISPTHYIPDLEEISTNVPETPVNGNYFPDDEDDEEEEERRFQALRVLNIIGEKDLTKGFTEVVEPDLCRFN